MTQDRGARVSPDDSIVSTDASQSRQRKKRKWDQPAEPLVSAGVFMPGVVSLGNVGALVGSSVPLPGAIPGVGASLLINPLVGSVSVVPPITVHVPPAAPQVPAKLKIQDELIIAREIVINDAEPSVRFKLTKRQTQEEIQKCTGAVVITRGKFRQPNAPPDGEKPLYLHISAAAHLKDTADRILAVDRAAAMVEEMLRQGQNIFPTFMSQSNGLQALSTSVFLGFDADPSLNVVTRIRGPNDQYIKHIMNETGATVVLKGHGSGLSGNFESPNGVEGQEALHLVLSAANSKSLEDAKRLAENLLDTIALECGASRVSSSNVYGAMPPPQTLLAGGPIPGYEHTTSQDQANSLMLSTVSTVAIPASADTVHGVIPVFSQGTMAQPLGSVNCRQVQSNIVGYPQPLVTGGTSYSGYGGIYPQATPLQQVALALKQSSSVTSAVAITTSTASRTPKPLGNSASEEKRRAQRRKFQELPLSSNGPSSIHKLQEIESTRPDGKLLTEISVRDEMTMPPPKMSVQSLSNGMPPPPPRSISPPPPQIMPPLAPPKSMPPPPPPPKFTSATPTKAHCKDNSLSNCEPKVPVVSDTLFKLMEYGEEDDDLEENGEEPVNSTSGAVFQKPFWAV